jgi:hypothetical protein
MSIRITSQQQAEAFIGEVITYSTKDGKEYGRIIRAVPSQVIVERLQRTSKGFEPHPEPVCPRTKNAMTFDRKIELIEEDITKL